MDEERAINILKALACCSVPKLHCDECPMWKPYEDGRLGGECYPWDDYDVVEAVRFLNGNTNYD